MSAAAVSPVEVVRELPPSETGARRVLVKRVAGHRWRFFVVSSVVSLYSGYETLVFPADHDGMVTDWGQVAGGRGVSREDAIKDLAALVFPKGATR